MTLFKTIPLFGVALISANLLAMQDYIEIDPTPIAHQTGSALRYYGEYRARILPNGLMSFPIASCYPLPINMAGNIRYFFTSATAGNISTPGEAIKIEDPAISNVVVVRGKDDGNENKFEAYIGYNKNDFKNLGRKRVYQSKILAINTKSTRYTENKSSKIFEPASHLSRMELAREGIRDNLSNHEVCWTQEENKLKGVRYGVR